MKQCQKVQFRLSEPRFFEEIPKDFYKNVKSEWSAFLQRIEDKLFDKLIVKKFLEGGMDYEK